MATYEGWDFANVWGRRNDRNDGYPYLRWTAPSLDNDADPAPVGISTLQPSQTDGHVDIYTPSGMLIYSGSLHSATFSTGLYIIRYADGSTRKVLVK